VGEGAAFLTLASVLPGKHAWVFVERELAETCRVFIGRTRTCVQLRSERTEDGMRTYCGRVERSVNEVVEL